MMTGTPIVDARCPACAAGLVPSSRALGGFPLLRCPRCGMHRAHSALGVPTDYTAIYDTREYLESQVADFLSGTAERFADIPTYRPFFQRLRPGGRSLLDVGCGVGRFCRAAAALGWRVTGIDVSARAIEIGSATAGFPMRVARLEELAAKGERFDVITGFELLEHLEDPHAFLAGVRALLPSGGEVFFTVPNWGHAEVQSATRADWLPPVHLSFFTGPALALLAERAGFEGVEVGPIWTGSPWSGRGGALGRVVRKVTRRRSPGLGLWLHARAGSGR